MNGPKAVAVDAQGDVYVGEAYGRVRKISSDGLITTIAGTDVQGFSGDGGPASAAQLRTPDALAVDAKGNLYIADGFNHRIRMITPNGTITTIAGNGDPGPEGLGGYSGDGGAAVQARLSIPAGLALDSHGNLYFADAENSRVRELTSDGVIHTVAGPTIGAPGQRLDPAAVTFDKADNMYIADNGNLLIWKIASDGTVSKIAGRGFPPGDSGDCSPSLQAAFGQALSIAIDARGYIYFADAAHDRIRRVSPDGWFATVAGNGAHGHFGYGQSPGDGGPATQVALGGPPSIALDTSGNLYIADEANMRVREVIAPSAAPPTCA